MKYKCFAFTFLFSVKGGEKFNATELLSQHQLHAVILGKSVVLKCITVHNTCRICETGEMEADEVSCSFESMK